MIMQLSCRDIYLTFSKEFLLEIILHHLSIATTQFESIGVHAASQDPLIVTFFDTIESMYLFFLDQLFDG